MCYSGRLETFQHLQSPAQTFEIVPSSVSLQGWVNAHVSPTQFFRIDVQPFYLLYRYEAFCGVCTYLFIEILSCEHQSYGFQDKTTHKVRDLLCRFLFLLVSPILFRFFFSIHWGFTHWWFYDLCFLHPFLSTLLTSLSSALLAPKAIFLLPGPRPSLSFSFSVSLNHWDLLVFNLQTLSLNFSEAQRATFTFLPIDAFASSPCSSFSQSCLPFSHLFLGSFSGSPSPLPMLPRPFLFSLLRPHLVLVPCSLLPGISFLFIPL